MLSQSCEKHDDLARIFFRLLKEKELTAIQFKSTERLKESFAGKTDFDLLVPPEEFQEVLRLAEGLGFVERLTSDPAHPEQVRDFLCRDRHSGKTHHLSFHSQLVFGSKPVKRHIVPEEIWSSFSRSRTADDVEILTVGDELALLVLRISLRVRLFSLRSAKWWVTGKDTHFPEHAMLEEARNLSRKIPDAKGFEPKATWRDEKVAGRSDDLFEVLRRSPIARSRFFWAQTRLRRALRPWVFLKGFDYVAKRIRLGFSRKSKTIRTTGQPGLVIAVVGIDGSGKSTLVGALRKNFEYKLSSQQFYLGQYKNTPTYVLLRYLEEGFNYLRIRRVGIFLSQLARVNIARLRAQESKRIGRFCAKGGIALVDRYPLREFRSSEAKMDSPVLDVGTFLGRAERRYADRIPPYPGGVIVLLSDVSTAASRKKADVEVLAQKANAVGALSESNLAAPSCFIKATLKPPEVLKIAETFCWSLLYGRKFPVEVRAEGLRPAAPNKTHGGRRGVKSL